MHNLCCIIVQFYLFTVNNYAVRTGSEPVTVPVIYLIEGIIMVRGNYSYYNPGKLLSGKNSLEAMSFELQSYGCKKPLVLFSGDNSDKQKEKFFIKSFCNSDILPVLLSKDRLLDNPDDIYNIYINRNCDSIIIIGTRESGIAGLVRISMDSGEMPSVVPETYKFRGRKTIPVIVVPSGIPDTEIYSDTIYYKDKRFRGNYLFPDVICIDPRMVPSKTPGEGVFSAFVAFAYSLESLMSSGNPFAASNTGIALKFINKYLPQYIKTPSDRNIAFGLCNGVIFASMGINNTPCGMMKNISLAYERISGEKSVRFSTQIFRSIFKHYLNEHKPDPVKLLLSLTDPDTAASVRGEAKLKMVQDIVKNVISLVEKSLGDNPPEIIMFPDYLKAIEAKAFMLSGQSIPKKDFEKVLTDAFA